MKFEAIDLAPYSSIEFDLKQFINKINLIWKTLFQVFLNIFNQWWIMYYIRFNSNLTKLFKWMNPDAIDLAPSSPIEFDLK